MAMSDARKLVIPYGAARLQPGWLSRTQSGGVACAVPHVVVDRGAGEALRLNSGQYEFATPPTAAEMGDPAARLDFLKRDMQRRCDMWNKRQARFLECYFDFLTAQVEASRDDLQRGLAEFGALYRYEDWMFSAPRPLPRAHLSAPAGEAAPTHDPASMVAVDFAFHTGDGPLAIHLAGAETGGARDSARDERLRAAGVVVLEIPQSTLADAQAFAALLPGPFHRFWEGQALPCGPFGTTALSDFAPGAGH